MSDREYKDCGCMTSNNTFKFVPCKEHSMNKDELNDLNNLLGRAKQALDDVKKVCIKVKKHYENGNISEEEYSKFKDSIIAKKERLEQHLKEMNDEE